MSFATAFILSKNNITIILTKVEKKKFEVLKTKNLKKICS